ncbi:uncharacterized protein IUM83_17078 [Phytophthora cinnamomi]|uniref:uncharacterized protein n=1 Tax=Phytophthora cinnamomi TaxID=4785 RepID=UPI00355A378A|nr:hypothetical protein IUM83_17078 [Phytophthora cinnamomi]
MKMSIAAIALALVYFVAFVTADPPTTVSSSPMSSDERMQLAKDIKELFSKNPSAVDPAIAAMSTESLFGLLSSLGSNPAVLTNAAGLISAVTSRNPTALASHATGLLNAALPALMSAVGPAAAAPTPAAAPAVSIAPIYVTSARVAPAAAPMST